MNLLASARKTAFGGEIELRFPFCQDLVDGLKDLPKRSRKWDNEDRVWRVQGVHAPAAIDLLLAYFPHAEVPDDRPRRRPSTPARTERPPEPALPLPPILIEPRPADEPPERNHLIATIRCPGCRLHFPQPVRVTAHTSAHVAKREAITPELVAVCPGCSCLAVVGFVPAPAAAS
jgi:hypothetical protein